MAMNKQDVRRSFERHGNFLSVTQVAECMGVDRGTARQMLVGLSYIPCGRKKLYHINDISERLMELKA